MDRWLPAHRAADGANGQYTMGYFTREDIPFQYALADAFTICDAYHSSVMGPTHPNRYMWLAGTLDPNGEFGGPCLDNNAPAGTYSFTTYPERLTKAGVSWKFYHGTETVTGLAPIARLKQYQNLPGDSTLARHGLAKTPTGRFEYDAINDRLPTVSWILPPSAADEHPAHTPAAGAAFVASKIDAIAANPEVWAKTVFILSYDENDGMFDHVRPPTPPPGTADEFVARTSPTGVASDGLPVGLGFRVPAIIVSPWTVGGWVCSQTFDHTSQLMFLERLTGVREPNISAWRRSVVGDLTSAFRLDQPSPRVPPLPETGGKANLAEYETSRLPPPAAPSGDQRMPPQEPGNRPRLP